MTDIEIEAHKKSIDKMPHIEMARLWRFAESGHPYFNTDRPLYLHFNERFKKLGGMTSEISKIIGWR